MTRAAAFRGILRYLRPQMPLVVLSLVCAAVSALAQLAVPFFVGQAIDCIVGAGEIDYARIYRLFIVIGACIAAAAAAQYAMSLINNRIVYRLLARVRQDAFSKLQRLPFRYLDAHAYGETGGIVLADAEQFSDGLLLGLTQLFTGIVTILGVLVILFLLRWEIALIVLCVTPVSLFTARFISSRTYKTFKRQAEVRAEQTAFIDEAIGNLKVVKAYSHEAENAAVFHEQNERFRKCALRAVFFSSTTNPTTRFINALIYAGVALAGALLVISSEAFSVGLLTSCLAYVNQYTKPFNEITEVLAEFQNAIACAGRLFTLIGEEEEPANDALPDLGHAAGEVALQAVDFSYKKDVELIKGLSVSVPAGRRVAIVGPTGCGKTTLINLLMRFYDLNAGRITVDGVDIRDVPLDEYRKLFGMVLQESFLSGETVAYNIAYGAGHASREQIEAAAKAAYCDFFINNLEHGYDTVLTGNVNISQGERQLLCIARVMLVDPPMLILDEATSNIDTMTEMRIQKAFRKIMKGRTSFIVAHRLSTILDADLILVMNHGSVIEQGTHAELMEKKGFYYELYNSQFANPESKAV